MMTAAAALTQHWIIDPAVDAGTTMRRMSKLCRGALRNASVIHYANEVIAQTAPRDYAAQIQAVADFGDQYFRFITNPVGEQLIRDPISMITSIEHDGFAQGACDDAAVLMATLCMANGVPCQFRALAFGPTPDPTAALTHVIADAWDDVAWIPMDITKPTDMTRALDVARTLTVEA